MARREDTEYFCPAAPRGLIADREEMIGPARGNQIGPIAVFDHQKLSVARNFFRRRSSAQTRSGEMFLTHLARPPAQVCRFP